MPNIFIIDIIYTKPLAEIDLHVAEHRAYLDKFYTSKHLIFSGRKNPPSGGIVVGMFADINEAEKFVAGDPFKIKNLADYKITEFNPVKYNQQVKDILGF
ncbi:MAG: YciI family protein [Rickettsiales bacterium]|nr:YciI family protein [Rickettsiales bacterium]